MVNDRSLDRILFAIKLPRSYSDVGELRFGGVNADYLLNKNQAVMDISEVPANFNIP